MKPLTWMVAAGIVAWVNTPRVDASTPKDQGEGVAASNSGKTTKVQLSGNRWASQDLDCSPPQGRLLPGPIQEISLPKPYEFLEGPAWLKTQHTLVLSAWNFSDPTEGKGPPTTILALSDNVWSERSAKGVLRTNGLAVDQKGALIAALHDDQSIGSLPLNTEQRQTIAKSFQGRPFNSPNDLTIRSDGTIYFTDPSYQNDNRPGQKPVTGVYRVSSQGEVFLVDGSRQQPNGIALSPDEKTLFVGTAEGIIFRYSVAADGSTGGAQTFSHPGKNIDGMTVDCLGNIYASIHEAQEFVVYNPMGAEIERVKVGYKITNLAFSDMDQKTLVITTAGHLFKMPSQVSGAAY
jgi:gluconolactonase